MRKNLLIFVCLLLASVASAQKVVNPRPFTIPAIHEWKGGTGHVEVNGQSRILVADTRLQKVAELLAEDLQTLTGQRLTVVAGSKATGGDIVFNYKPQKALGDEGYTIDINKHVSIAATERGALYAVQTLLQIIEGSEKANNLSSFILQRLRVGASAGIPSSISFPKGRITDKPDYRLRGLMLDCGRKFIPIDYMRRLVRTMAYYKMNTLGVHLNDNIHCKYAHDNWDETYAAFRMESERFPGLTAEDGHYGKAEFRQFVLDAAELGVEVIPEIDVPAHSLAFSHYRPSLGSKEFGMDHLDLTNPELIPFVDSVFAEYLEGPEPVFAGPRVHIGTDEYNNKKQDIVERFRALADHTIRTVESYGKQAAFWGSLTHARGTTPVKVDNVLMYAWYNGYADPDSMMRLGYQLVSIPDRTHYIVPAAGYYYDYLNISNLYKNWTPAVIAQAVFPERHPQIEGGMFAVWNDIVGNGIAVSDIHHRVFPAVQVVAEKCWTVDTVRTYNDWQRLADGMGEAPGINDLGRYPKGIVMEQNVVEPGSTRPIPRIGWPYRVSFDIETASALTVGKAEGGVETRGTALFRNDDAEFYLADPVTGRLGFVRDNYLFTFRHSLQPGVREHIAIEGTNRETRLYVNGKLVETLGPDRRFFNKTDAFNIIRTLCFPLQQTDAALRSRVTNLKVESL